MKVFFDSVGCRLNQSEIETYALQFRTAGHEVVGTAQEADLVVINTCAVTTEAAADSRQKSRRAARLMSPDGGIVVTGCWSTLEPQAAKSLPGVRQVVPNSVKDHLTELVLNHGEANFDLEPIARLPLPGLHQRTRAFLKVQDGCDNVCTFCVTRVARGSSRSRTVMEVGRDIDSALAGEVKEIVLSGVHLGSWGFDFSPAMKLNNLVHSLLQRGGFKRLRLSSLEPWDLNEEFFDLFADRRLCRHFHLPLQSGCAATLRRMARKTSPDDYARLVATIRRRMPDAAITTDVIVGFPGEDEVEFAESLTFVREMEFSGGHVFNYSARPGTAAVRLPGHVRPEVRKERSEHMRAVFEQSAIKFSHNFIDQKVEVLWEGADRLGPAGWQMTGLTHNYLKVSALTSRYAWNEIDLVKIDAYKDDRLVGTIVPA